MSDITTVRMVVGFLGVTILACVIGGFHLAGQGVELPEFLVGLGGTALGALGALLARTDNRVTVDNEPSDPVPTTPTQHPKLPEG